MLTNQLGGRGVFGVATPREPRNHSGAYILYAIGILIKVSTCTQVNEIRAHCSSRQIHHASLHQPQHLSDQAQEPHSQQASSR